MKNQNQKSTPQILSIFHSNFMTFIHNSICKNCLHMHKAAKSCTCVTMWFLPCPMWTGDMNSFLNLNLRRSLSIHLGIWSPCLHASWQKHFTVIQAYTIVTQFIKPTLSCCLPTSRNFIPDFIRVFGDKIWTLWKSFEWTCHDFLPTSKTCPHLYMTPRMWHKQFTNCLKKDIWDCPCLL